MANAHHTHFLFTPMIFYQSTANALSLTFFILFVTNLWPIATTHFFFLHFLDIHSWCPLPTSMVFTTIQPISPTHPFIVFFTNSWPMPTTHIFLFTPMTFYQSTANSPSPTFFICFCYQFMTNAHHPHIFYLFVTNLQPVPITNIFLFIFITNLQPMPATHIFFICLLPIYSQCPPPHFFIHFLDIYSQCPPPTFCIYPMANVRHPHFVFTPQPMPITNIFLSVLLLMYSQCPPITFLYSP